ncbi:MAG: flagellar assembly protein FliW [Oscillospiraceae bacterium]|nr:flagellar assembly protein FliW [Oscillospiraceae bacterium]
MIIETRDFGKTEVSEENIYHFTQPLFGFEDYTDFAVLNDRELGEDIVWLQSLQNSGLCFIMMDPGKLAPDYSPVLPAGSDELLGEGDLFCWAVAVIPRNFKDSTVNLKSPVFLNPANHLAAQIMLEGEYPVRYPLSKEGQSSCL